MPPSTDQLTRSLLSFLRRALVSYPGCTPTMVRIYFKGCDKCRPLSMSIAPAIAKRVRALLRRDNGGGSGRPRGSDPDAERAILRALQEAPRPLKRADLAAAAGLEPTGGHFKEAFARLRRTGRIYRPDPSTAAYWPQGRHMRET